MKYRIIQNDFRNDDTGLPVLTYYIEYFKTSFWGFNPRWIKYTIMTSGQFGAIDYPVSFKTIEEARIYLMNIQKPLIKNKIHDNQENNNKT